MGSNKRQWEKKIEKVSRFLKTFTPKNSNLDVLESYGKVLDDSYWDKWEGNSYKQETGSFISHMKLAEAAARLGIMEKAKVAETCKMLKEGASTGPNSSTVYNFGSRVADSLQTAVKDGIMYGPLLKSQIPWTE